MKLTSLHKGTRIAQMLALSRSGASGSVVPKPSVLLTVALAAGLPFIFFGFSDNAIMVSS